MKSDAAQANNLFSRLFTYAPQESGRSQLENFCTESLAWCLKHCPRFRANFLDLIRCNLETNQRNVFPADFDKSHFAVHTQLSFDSDDSDEGQRGLFDLVMMSENVVIIVEVKFDSDFGVNQIAKYRQELNSGNYFADYAQKYLVTLTRQAVPSDLYRKVDASIFWRDVLGQLHESISEARSKSANRPEGTAIRFMLEQFGDFLVAKHVTSMKIEKLILSDLEGGKNIFAFQAASFGILERFCADQKAVWKAKKIECGNNDISGDKNYFSWWGVYGKNHPYDWCGFVYTYSANPSEVFMQIEGTFSKRIQKNQVQSLLSNDGVLKSAVLRINDDKLGETWIEFRQAINPNFNGNAEKMYEWLASAANEFVDLRKRLK